MLDRAALEAKGGMVMAEKTKIEWCDSVCNLQMGCAGCELWLPEKGVKHCYAGTLTERYGGRSGWPKKFEEPALFLERMDEAMLWADMTGMSRSDKPWLNGLPRVVFLNDMGDTFTEGLDADWLARPFGPTRCPRGHKRPRVQWLAEEGKWVCSAAGCAIQWSPSSPLELMGRTPHVWMLLTKRAKRLREFSERYPLPKNVWPGVSVTTQGTAERIEDLLAVQGGGVKWVSAEPLLGPVHLYPKWLTTELPCPDGIPGCEVLHMGPPSPLHLVIIGGESGSGARPCNLEWIRSLVRQCQSAGCAAFVKQLGAWPVDVSLLDADQRGPFEQFDEVDLEEARLDLRDKKGGDMEAWPADLRVRQMPKVSR